MDGTPKITFKTWQSLMDCRFPHFAAQKVIIPPCSMGLRPAFANLGGCHE